MYIYAEHTISLHPEHTRKWFKHWLSIHGNDFIAPWACAEMFKSRISWPNRIQFSKISCVTRDGPWDHKVLVSAEKEFKKVPACVPLTCTCLSGLCYEHMWLGYRREWCESCPRLVSVKRGGKIILKDRKVNEWPYWVLDFLSSTEYWYRYSLYKSLAIPLQKPTYLLHSIKCTTCTLCTCTVWLDYTKKYNRGLKYRYSNYLL